MAVVVCLADQVKSHALILPLTLAPSLPTTPQRHSNVNVRCADLQSEDVHFGEYSHRFAVYHPSNARTVAEEVGEVHEHSVVADDVGA